MNKPRPRRHYAVGLARRQYILDAATVEFARHGYRGASLAKIAAGVGVTQAGLLHHFRSKAELLTAVLDQRDDIDADALGLLDPDAPSNRGVLALDQLVELVARNTQRRGLVQLFAVIVGEAVTEDHPAYQWAHQRYDLIRRSLIDSLGHGVSDGQIRPEIDLGGVASATLATMDGLQIQWLLDPRIDMVSAFGDHVNCVKRAIAPSA